MLMELYNAFREANFPESVAQKAVEAIERNVLDVSEKMRKNLHMDEIIPIEKENIGIRSEIRFLAERMDHRFAESESRIQAVIEQMKFGFSEMEKRFQIMNEQMRFGFAESDKRIQAVIEQMKFGFAETDKRLELMNDSTNRRFANMEKLQIAMLGCLIGLLVKFLFFN